MRDFRELNVWQKAHALAMETYAVTRQFPKEELYGLTSQMRRASTSIPANICEGCGRDTNPDFARFLRNAIGSAFELEYFLILARDLTLINAPRAETLLTDVREIKRMLSAFLKNLKGR